MSASAKAQSVKDDKKNVKSAPVSSKDPLETDSEVPDQKLMVSSSSQKGSDIDPEIQELFQFLLTAGKLPVYPYASIPKALSSPPSSSSGCGSGCKPELKQFLFSYGSSGFPLPATCPAVLGVGYGGATFVVNNVGSGVSFRTRLSSSICMREFHFRGTYDVDGSAVFNWPIRVCLFVDKVPAASAIIVGDAANTGQLRESLFVSDIVTNSFSAIGNALQRSGRFHILHDKCYNALPNAANGTTPVASGGSHFEVKADLRDREVVWFDSATSTAIMQNALWMSIWSDVPVGAGTPPTVYGQGSLTFYDS